MQRKGKKLLSGLSDLLLLIRLHFVRIRKPGDARTSEQMLEEIKKKSKLT